MPKSVEACVRKLLNDPKFNPDITKGKANKSKEEIAWAICNSKYKKENTTCSVCEIDNDELFNEAVKEIMKSISEEKPVNESYTLDGISFTFNEGVSDDDLAKINKFTVKPVESKDVVVYTALLIDDKITRNHTQYNKDFQSMLLSLPAGEGNFIGSPILFGENKDHQHTASSQVGRIFDAWQVVSKEKNYGVMAKIYLLKETNEDLINKINSGVLKEMSISTKVEMPLCSICRQNVSVCDHTPGQNGCHIIMSGKGFVAEASFVAVPGSNSAKILSEDETKNFLRLENLKDLVGPMITEEMTSVLPSGSLEGLNDKILLLTENYDKMLVSLQGIEKLVKESETTVFPLDIASAIKDLVADLATSKEFVIKALAKFNLPAAEFGSDAIPDLEQGLKGANVNTIIKLIYDNVEVLGINLSKIEKHLKAVPEPTNPTYQGDINDLVNVARFMIKKMDNIKTRIYKIQGRFDLELEERTKLISETIKFGILSGKFNFSEKNLSEKFFEQFTTEEIIILKEKFFAEGSKIYTRETIELPEIKDENKNKEEVKPASLKEIAKKILGGNTNGKEHS